MKKMRVRLLLFAGLLPAFADDSEARLTGQNATPNLAGTSWQLLNFQGGDGKTLSSADQTKYTVAFTADGRVSVRIDCTQAARGSETLTVTFYQTAPGMALVERGTQARPAFQVPAADGAKYEGQDLMFWDARGEAQVNWSGAELKCRPR